MNVRCPSCQTVFRVDPDKIPATGIKARCARCQAVFRLTPAGASQEAPSAVVGAGVSGSAAAGLVSASPSPSVAPPPAAPAPTPPPAPPVRPVMPPPPPPVAPAPAPPVARPAAPPSPAASAPPVAAAAPTAPQPAPPVAPAAPTPGAKRPSFRNQDPGARAQRIARALVSDIVAYNKDKLKGAALDAATLRNEFREEIRKSWEEYVEQVGLEMAKNTPYFRDSLNEILAKGQKVF